MKQRELKKGITLYYQIENLIREKINRDEWKKGSRLPSEIELAEMFNVSRSTIRQSISNLVATGLLVRKQGSGTYITEPSYARDRLHSAPSELICRHVYNPLIESDILYSYKNILLMNEVHILMLHNVGLIEKSDTITLLKFIEGLFSKDPAAIGIQPDYEDYYLNFEHYIITALGVNIAGRINIARSRNEMIPTVTRMNVRDMIRVIYKDVLELLSIILELAEYHLDTLMTGYTHLQAAQPITLGFYFLAISEAIFRDLDRLFHAYNALNICPHGSCAFAGSSFPINRKYCAKALGFSEPVENNLDAVASRDFLLEISSAFATLGSTLGRFSEDLYLWTTAEYGYIELDDSISCSSSSMPQKKNPLSIEHIKSKTSHLAASYIDIFSCLKGVSFQHCRDLTECIIPFENAYQQLHAILVLLNETLYKTTFHTERMNSSVEKNTSTLSDLAEYLTMREKVPFRVAHKIIGTVVRKCLDYGINAKDLKIEMLNEVGYEIAGYSFHITQEELRSVLNPENSVKNKKNFGSTAPENCVHMLQVQKAQLSHAIEHYEALYQKVDNAYKATSNEIKKLIADM